MLESQKPRVYNENKVVTSLGQGTKIVGELRCSGTIRVEGMVEGSINSEDSVVLLETAKVKGDIVAGQVIISGEVRGNVRAIDRLEVLLHGKILGNICAPRISIHEGVFFEGICAMKPESLPSEVRAAMAKASGGK